MVFERSNFAGNADFSYSKFNKSIILNKAEFKEKAFFYDVDITDNVRICLNETQFDKIYLRWDKIKPGFFKNCRLVYNEEAYLSLIDNYKKLGWLKDANECFYEYKKNYRSTLWGIYWIADFFQWLLHGYGVKPDFFIIWSLVVVIAFAIFFWRADWTKFPKFRDAFTFSTTVFLSETGKLFVEKPDYDPKNYAFLCRTIFNLERLLGCTLIFMFIISVSKTIGA